MPEKKTVSCGNDPKCELEELCKKMHYVIHACGCGLEEKEWDQVENMSKKLLEVLNEQRPMYCDAVKVLALWMLIQTGVLEIENEQQLGTIQ